MTQIESIRFQGVRDSIYSLKNAGVDIKMVTGDSEETAVGIGVKLGIHE